MRIRRVTLFAGHYGSGKTNIAVNYALYLRSLGKPVALGDLDIVNPYYRAKDSQAELEAAGMRLIASAYANSNVDVPAIPQEMYALTEDKNSFAVMDIGGDDRGALALGRYMPAIASENDYDMLFVFNRSRPLTRDAQSALGIMREIEDGLRAPLYRSRPQHESRPGDGPRDHPQRDGQRTRTVRAERSAPALHGGPERSCPATASGYWRDFPHHASKNHLVKEFCNGEGNIQQGPVQRLRSLHRRLSQGHPGAQPG